MGHRKQISIRAAIPTWNSLIKGKCLLRRSHMLFFRAGRSACQTNCNLAFDGYNECGGMSVGITLCMKKYFITLLICLQRAFLPLGAAKSYTLAFKKAKSIPTPVTTTRFLFVHVSDIIRRENYIKFTPFSSTPLPVPLLHLLRSYLCLV